MAQHISNTNIQAVGHPADRQPTVGNLTQRKWLRIGAIAAMIGVGLLAAGAAYVWFSGGSGDASSAISAPSLMATAGDTRTLFSITADESEARFIIDETLLNNPKTVVGSTHEVAGDLLVDLQNPANTQLGTIRINVKTLKTDNEFRNRALRGQILQVDQPEYEFAVFTPSALLNLPDQVIVGTPVDFQIKGDLTLHGVTREVTFDTTLTLISDRQLSGMAQATVMHSDFGITIPSAPGVANVSDAVGLEIAFMAQAAN